MVLVLAVVGGAYATWIAPDNSVTVCVTKQGYVRSASSHNHCPSRTSRAALPTVESTGTPAPPSTGDGSRVVGSADPAGTTVPEVRFVASGDDNEPASVGSASFTITKPGFYTEFASIDATIVDGKCRGNPVEFRGFQVTFDSPNYPDTLQPGSAAASVTAWLDAGQHTALVRYPQEGCTSRDFVAGSVATSNLHIRVVAVE